MASKVDWDGESQTKIDLQRPRMWNKTKQWQQHINLLFFDHESSLEMQKGFATKC